VAYRSERCRRTKSLRRRGHCGHHQCRRQRSTDDDRRSADNKRRGRKEHPAFEPSLAHGWIAKRATGGPQHHRVSRNDNEQVAHAKGAIEKRERARGDSDHQHPNTSPQRGGSTDNDRKGSQPLLSVAGDILDIFDDLPCQGRNRSQEEQDIRAEWLTKGRPAEEKRAPGEVGDKDVTDERPAFEQLGVGDKCEKVDDGDPDSDKRECERGDGGNPKAGDGDAERAASGDRPTRDRPVGLVDGVDLAVEVVVDRVATGCCGESSDDSGGDSGRRGSDTAGDKRPGCGEYTGSDRVTRRVSSTDAPSGSDTIRLGGWWE